MKTIISILFYSTLSFSVFSIENQDIKNCLSSREYITTVQYLREHKDFALSEKEIKMTADKVSLGCLNSSQRFINTVKLLTNLGVDTRSSIQTALNFSQKTDEHSQAFIEIFKYAYNPEKLDLDVLSSLNLSLQLSAFYEGYINNAIKNFKDLVSFCIENKSLDLPHSSCAKLATEITINGKDYKEPIAPKFKTLVSFLKIDSQGPKLSLLESIAIAKNIISYGETASENFTQGFKFAISEKGLNYSTKMAMDFAKSMAMRSFQK